MRTSCFAALLAFASAGALGAQTPAAPAPPAPPDTAPAAMTRGVASRGNTMRAEPKTGWLALDAFHETLAATWHPAARSNDLAPARTRAGELWARADSLSATTAPASLSAECKAAATPAALGGLAREAKAFADLSAGRAPDPQLKAALRRVHDRFELFEHRCAPAGEHDEHAGHGTPRR